MRSIYGVFTGYDETAEVLEQDIEPGAETFTGEDGVWVQATRAETVAVVGMAVAGTLAWCVLWRVLLGSWRTAVWFLLAQVVLTILAWSTAKSSHRNTHD